MSVDRHFVFFVPFARLFFPLGSMRVRQPPAQSLGQQLREIDASFFCRRN
jgi:hypothetical protein